ncbi:MAG: double-stranded DNA-binding protein [Nitrosopumilus sp.]|nr:double-stranded DNA-binding protein [Nitrosopumilus sp.]
MNEEDSELERLKAKRLAEMQKNISSRQEIQTPKSPEKIIHPNPRDSLIKILGFRGLEVLENAESQFPNESKIIVEKLSELIKTGEIHETIDGGKLLALFRSVGVHVRMETKINIEQDGKFVSLSDKLSNHPSYDGD